MHHPGPAGDDLDVANSQTLDPQQPGRPLLQTATHGHPSTDLRYLRTLNHARDFTPVTMNCFDTAMITEVTGPNTSTRSDHLPGQVRRAPNATHWSRAKMAQRTGLSTSTIGRIWKAFDLKPRRADGLKPSNDPLFVEKVYDIVGLYLDPPEAAVVLCVDELCEASHNSSDVKSSVM